MNKVISFSLWGNDQMYLQGAIRNAELAKIYFPDWRVWVYFPEEELKANPDLRSIYRKLTDLNCTCIIQTDNPIGYQSLFLRFQAAFHPDVDVMISRDCDSRLCQKDADLVNEWLIKSEELFHTIHHHVWHTVPIMGGLWGMKCTAELKEKFKKYYDEWDKKDEKGNDQNFLTTFFPEIMHTQKADKLTEPLEDGGYLGEVMTAEDKPFRMKDRYFISND